MAGNAHGKATGSGDETAPRTSIDEHQRTYDRFMSITKWAMLVVVLILVGMYVFLV